MKHVVFAAAILTGLFACSASAFDLKRIAIPSAAMGKSPQATVITPDAYQDQTRHFATVYLLHGWAGNDQDWSAKSDIGKLADLYRVIVVMPDGGFDKWYIDSPESPKDKYETYVGKEVVAYIDQHYRTIARKSSRAITGLSMGGFGALTIAGDYSDTFGIAGSISGGVDPREFPNNWGIDKAFGNRATNAAFWNRKAVINNVDRFLSNGVDVTIECGVDDFFIEVNRALHQRMLDLKIPHDYAERPGKHNWDYWSNAIRYQMLFIATKFDQSRNQE